MVKLEVTQDFNEFIKLVEASQKKVGDLRPALESMAIRWFRSNKALFLLQSKGGYENDLSDKYKILKERAVGFVYPMLKFTGDLEDSLTNMGNEHAYKQFVGKKGIEVGTTVPYAFFLQEGTKFMPPRPPVLLGVEKQATVEQGKNIEEWSRILLGFVGETIGERLI